ncbi:unnamed protein product [Paramecium octaurelia]|uniref:Uncharacterized protein n=1 Tax=Paramecium octaurelia TaxID=43137 RepID=A0A8S1X417_PAROT|nr:unnamed protein product [Paramecium octaurelia]
MNISLSEFEDEEFNDLYEKFSESAQQLTTAPDEIMFIDDLVLSVHITYDDVLKLNNDGKMNFKSMIYFINYLQKRSKTVHQYYLAYQRQMLDLVEQLNPLLRKNQQKGDPINYILIFYWNDRWVTGIYNLKTTILDIVDLQKNKTKDELKKTYEQLLKKTGLAKVSFKTVNYVYQEDKTTDGGMYIINYLYQTIVKGQSFVKLQPNDKVKLKSLLLWLFFRGEKSQHVDYPPLPALAQWNENEIKQYQNTNLEPFLTGYWTGIEVQQADFELLQKSGKSKPHMIAFWLSYLNYFDLLSKTPLIPFFVVANGDEIREEFEVIFKPRRRQGAENHRLIILQYIKNTRWVFAIYHMIQKTLDIIDLQNKNVTKDELKNSFDKLISSLVTYSNPAPNYIFQSYTDSSDGTEYVINWLWQYTQGILPDKIKFGFSEKRQLRSKLVWALIKMQQTVVSSQKSIQIASKKKITIPQIAQTPQAQPQQSEVQNTPSQAGGNRFGRFRNNTSTNNDSPQQKSNKNIEEQTPQQKKTFVSSFRNRSQIASQQSPMNSPQKSVASDQKSEQQEPISKKSSLFSKSKPQSDQSPKSQTSETSIQLAKPASRTFTGKKTVLQSGTKVGTTKNSSALLKQEPIIETQRSEEYDEDEFSDLFNKKKKSIDNPQQYMDNQDRLAKIQEELTEYYHELINDDVDKDLEIQKLQEVFRINGKIKQYLEQRKKMTIDEVLDTVQNKSTINQSAVYNSNLQNYSTILHDDQSILRMINEMIQGEENEESLQNTLLRRQDYVKKQMEQMDVSTPNVDYEFPKLKEESTLKNQSINLPTIRRQTSEFFQKSNITAKRYGMKLEVPMMQQFYKDGKVNNLIFNFLLKFFEEKSFHQRKNNNVFHHYSTNVKLFPTQFYQTLCFNLIHSTFRINYFEANQFTFEYTGQDETIFDIFDWLVVPIVEYPTEYSIVFVNLKRKTCYCYLLSSLSLRIKDPQYINPEKNPYMKNVISFLQYEFEIKLKKPREELGRFSYLFGVVNDTNSFGQSLNYDYSGLYALYIILHLVKHGHNSEIAVDQYQIQVLKKVFHDLIVKIGYNEDDNLFHLLEENQFPF